MTTDPIKLKLMDAIETAVAAIDGVGKVRVDPARGFRDQDPTPYTNILTTPESSRKENLFRHSTFDMSIHIFVKKNTDDDARRACIKLLADLQMALLPRGKATRSFSISFEEDSNDAADILFIEDNFCIAVANYHVQYRTAYANPYSQNP